VFLQQKGNTIVLGDASTLLSLLSAGLITPCQQPASQLFPTLAEWHKVEPYIANFVTSAREKKKICAPHLLKFSIIILKTGK
jgi:hypothetical protein